MEKIQKIDYLSYMRRRIGHSIVFFTTENPLDLPWTITRSNFEMKIDRKIHFA